MVIHIEISLTLALEIKTKFNVNNRIMNENKLLYKFHGVQGKHVRFWREKHWHVPLFCTLIIF